MYSLCCSVSGGTPVLTGEYPNPVLAGGTTLFWGTPSQDWGTPWYGPGITERTWNLELWYQRKSPGLRYSLPRKDLVPETWEKTWNSNNPPPALLPSVDMPVKTVPIFPFSSHGGGKNMIYSHVLFCIIDLWSLFLRTNFFVSILVNSPKYNMKYLKIRH